MIYLVILFLLVYFAYQFDIRGVQKGKNEWYKFLLYAIILLVGLRYRIGTDSITYESWFKSSDLPTLGGISLDTFRYNKYEPLFIILGSIVKTIFNSWIVFQIIHAIIINTIVFWFFKKYSTAPFICITIYFMWVLYPFNCEIMRQSLGTSVCLLAMPSLLGKNYKKYYLLILLAFLFHRSSILFAFLPFLLVLTKRSVLITVVVVSLIVALPLSEYLNDNYLAILLLFDESSGAYEALNQNFQGGGFADLNYSVRGLLVFFSDSVLIYIICKLKESKRIVSMGESNNLSYQYFDIGISLFIIIQTLSLTFTIFYRFAWLFFAFAILYLASFIKNSNTKKLGSQLLLIMVVFLFLFRVYSDNFMSKERDSNIRYYRRFVPYTSIITKETVPERERIFRDYNKQ